MTFATLAAALLLIFFTRLGLPVIEQDEGILLVYPDLVLRGLVPNRDFATLYTPAAIWSVAAAFWLFGASVAVERSVGFLFQVALLAAVVRMGGRIGPLACLLAGIGTCTAIALLPTPGAFSVLGGLAAGMWALAAGHKALLGPEKDGARWATVSGILAGVALLFRQDVGVIAIASASLLTLSARPAAARRVSLYFSGVAIGLIPLAVHAAMAGPGALYENYVIDVLRNAPGRAMPLRLANVSLLLILNAAIAASATGLWLLKVPRHEAVLTSSLAVFALGLLPSALQRADQWHVAYVSAAALPIAILTGSMLMRALAERDARNGKGAVGLRLPKFAWTVIIPFASLLWLAAIFLKGPPFDLPAPSHRLGSAIGGARPILVARERAQELGRVLASASKLPSGSSLFIGPQDLRRTNYGDTMLYFALPEIRPGAYYLEMNPGVANRPGSRLAADIARADYLLLTSQYDRWDEPNDSSRPGDARPGDIVRRLFCEQQRIGRYTLLERCR